MRQGDPWDVGPDQVREVTRNLKSLLRSFVQEDGDAGGGGMGGGQRLESRFWEVELPAFIERCLSSTIVDVEALPPIHELFMVSGDDNSHLLQLCVLERVTKRLRYCEGADGNGKIDDQPSNR